MHGAITLAAAGFKRVSAKTKAQLSLRTHPPSKNGPIFAQANRMSFATSYLSYDLILETQ